MSGRALEVWRRSAAVPLVLAALTSSLAAQERYALIVTGAAGGAEYAVQYRQLSDTFARTLVEQLGFDPARIDALWDSEAPESSATAANVRSRLTSLRRSLGRDDLLIVLLIGHGTFDGVDAKFNLVGPDLESAEWASLFQGLRGRLVAINAAPASFPFLERLAGPRRVVISATDSAAQRFDTVFPEHFIAAFTDASADIDKNGRTSVWEAFVSAAAGVRKHYQQRGQLATERPLLDDNGDGVGRDALAPGEDGSLASRTYLDAANAEARPTDEVLLRLLQRRSALEAEADELKVKKTFMQPLEYAAEFEKLMIELATISRDIRRRLGAGS